MVMGAKKEGNNGCPLWSYISVGRFFGPIHFMAFYLLVRTLEAFLRQNRDRPPASSLSKRDIVSITDSAI